MLQVLKDDSTKYVTVCFGTPVLPADLSALSPGYRVLPDLATMPTSLRMHGLRSHRPATLGQMFKMMLPAL